MPITSERRKRTSGRPWKGFQKDLFHRLAACSRGKILQARAEESAKTEII